MSKHDGIHSMVKRGDMSSGAIMMRDFYEQKPDAHIYQKEFGFYCLDRWKAEGHITDDTDFDKLFSFDERGTHSLGELGWCEAAFEPSFEDKQIEDRGKYEVIQDFAGRHVLVFKGRRQGFMPEYLDHPVKDMKTWEDNCKWRLNAANEDRLMGLDVRMDEAKNAAAAGMIMNQQLIGGYMYLRSLIGPVDLLYKFYDEPELIHDCMQTWLKLADSIISEHQTHVTLDELFLAEDICYNNGSLISPDMIREFLFPYYKQLIDNTKARQIDKSRRFYLQVDTDGYSNDVIPVYGELGLNYMSPFEVASGSDVVEIGKQFKGLLMLGGFDKRILAKTKEDIDREVDRIMPTMKKRGGYIPTCDHGVPEEVSFENYVHFRKRLLEFN